MSTNTAPGTQNNNKISLEGLSTDTKPTGTYNGEQIANGSTFMELDTKTLYFYDEANDTWV